MDTDEPRWRIGYLDAEVVLQLRQLAGTRKSILRAAAGAGFWRAYRVMVRGAQPAAGSIENGFAGTSRRP